MQSQQRNYWWCRSQKQQEMKGRTTSHIETQIFLFPPILFRSFWKWGSKKSSITIRNVSFANIVQSQVVSSSFVKSQKWLRVHINQKNDYEYLRDQKLSNCCRTKLREISQSFFFNFLDALLILLSFFPGGKFTPSQFVLEANIFFNFLDVLLIFSAVFPRG